MASIVEDRVKAVLVEQFGVDEDKLQNSTTFVELDSTGGIESAGLLTKFEDAFGIEVPDGDFESLKTVGDAVTYFEQRVQ